MQMFSAKVFEGRVEVPDGFLPDGARVVVLVPEDDEGFSLTEAEKADLKVAIEQLRRGEGVDGWELLRELKR